MDADTKTPLEHLTEALKADPSYAETWHDNIACAVRDARGDPNEAASRFMRSAFGVDTVAPDQRRSSGA